MFYDKAITLILKAEGGYVNKSLDKGGETIAGITRKQHPELSLWLLADEVKRQQKGKIAESVLAKIINERLLRDPLVMAEVQDTYKKNYWNKCRCDSLPPIHRYPLFSCAVNCGVGTASKLYQSALSIVADGIIGPKTAEIAAKTPPQPVLIGFFERWAEYYDRIVASSPEQKVWLNGWKNRITEVKKDNE